MTIDPASDRLADELARIDAVHDPDGWAVAAYRLGVARSESAVTPGDLAQAVEVLERAASILTADRAPLEHARIRTALGSCARAAARPQDAVEDFTVALALGRDRFAASEFSAAHANLGLALAEAGRAEAAVDVLDEGLAAPVDDDADGRRVRGVLHLNRAQAFQQLPTGLDRAVADYRASVALLPSGGPQQGMALHGLGTALLAAGDVDGAVAALRSAVSVLTIGHFPMQHAIARHSLAVALERRATADDLRRALFHAEVAVRTFDPRLHRAAWTTASDSLGRICGELGITTSVGDRPRSFADLLAGSDPEEARSLVRDHLGRLAAVPGPGRPDDLRALAAAIESLDEPAPVVSTLVSVLMELPDDLLDEACRALAEAGAASGPASDFDRTLDDAVHEVLFGPQRVRVRDLLASHGWVRP
jgi:tetratricopeptide (TPR) repeat protein